MSCAQCSADEVAKCARCGCDLCPEHSQDIDGVIDSDEREVFCLECLVIVLTENR